jgi:iron-sulfur cluster repair protein YtfE (RIC family)
MTPPVFDLSTPIGRIIRLRPAALTILEPESQYGCWSRLDDSLARFCAAYRKDPSDLLARLLGMPPVPADTDWAAVPLYRLIDHLTQNHREFREKDMPSIDALLETQRLPAYPDGYVVKLLLQEFRHFRKEFLKHMDEEEAFLFPIILRDEARSRHPGLEVGDFQASANLYLRMETHTPEAEFKRMITSIQEKLRHQLMHRPAAELAAKVQEALDGFAVKLKAHADLEEDVLSPRAVRLKRGAGEREMS